MKQACNGCTECAAGGGGSGGGSGGVKEWRAGQGPGGKEGILYDAPFVFICVRVRSPREVEVFAV